MNLLVACIGNCDPISDWDQSQLRALEQSINSKSFIKVLCLYSQRYTRLRPRLNDYFKVAYPHLDVQHEVITGFEPSDAVEAAIVLKTKLAELIDEHLTYNFLPNISDSLWHTAALILEAKGVLNLIEPSYKGTICDAESLSLRIDLSVAVPQEKFVDDLAFQMGLIGNHPAFNQVIYQANRLAKSDFPVFLLGASGTGKGMFARYIHAISQRSQGPFIALNCAALPENLVESILFGHEKGAFTGAIRDFKGKFRQANGGTLFLDEIGELPIFVQAKLLKAIEEFEIESLGASSPEKVDIRIIAATNKNISAAIEDKTFREDLYFRLRVGELLLPTLVERSSDIPDLAIYLLKIFNQTYKSSKRLSSEALSFLEKQNWPGNIRDLNNTLMRAALMSMHQVLQPEDFELHFSETLIPMCKQLPDLYPGFSIEEYLSKVRSALIKKALDQARGNQSHAARLLGVSPQAISKFCTQKIG